MTEAAPVLAGRGLSVRYARRDGRGFFVALDEVTIELQPAEIYALVGRSGAGKSTLARVLAGLERPDAGSVEVCGEPIGPPAARARCVQLVFQDPAAALSPRRSVAALVAEPLLVHGLAVGGRQERVEELLRAVGLPSDARFLTRRPRELSGGERQRLAVARALACEPRALVLDEPVSALDVSVRGLLLNLLLELRRSLDVAMLIISHDVALAGGLADRVGVMAAGRLVEEGPAAQLLHAPRSPAAAELVAASREKLAALGGDAAAGKT